MPLLLWHGQRRRHVPACLCVAEIRSTMSIVSTMVCLSVVESLISILPEDGRAYWSIESIGPSIDTVESMAWIEVREEPCPCLD